MCSLLEPCWQAMMDLQGQVRDGRPCALFNVLPDIECILEHLTDAYKTYKDAPEETIEGQFHFKAQLKMALDTAQKYYSILDETPVYLAAVILHPKYTFKFVESQWANKIKWVKAGKKAVAALWSAQYKQQEALVADRSPAKASWPREENTIQAYRSRGIRAARTVSTMISAVVQLVLIS
jgi:hypothetical protein